MLTVSAFVPYYVIRREHLFGVLRATEWHDGVGALYRRVAGVAVTR
jgi:hypothetical protein